jgi:hypothetical protein
MNFKEINRFWQLLDPLTVEQAAALIAGFDPNAVDVSGNCFKSQEAGLTDSDGMASVQAAFAGMVNAINGCKLKAELRYDAEPRYTAGMDNLMERGYWRNEDVGEVTDEDGSQYVIDRIPNWGRTTVSRADLVEWLENCGVQPSFFFPNETDSVDYLNNRHPRYSAKLAASVAVWRAMEDENLRRGVSTADAMRTWLESRYKELGLVWNGGVNKTGIQEVAKVANWDTSGGAPKTPGD